MVPEDVLRQVVHDQKARLPIVSKTIPRQVQTDIPESTEHAVIISGIRRCGKSTLMLQWMAKKPRAAYFNFDDTRLTALQVDDFGKLARLLEEEYGHAKHYFLDEVQEVPGWERFVRLLLDQQKRVVATGSNATLLSRELGTKLTGRHLRFELFPFSYAEMLEYTRQKPGTKSLHEYLEKGGFPTFLKEKNSEALQQLLADVIARDVAVRHKLREVKILGQMAIFLLNNVGRPFSYNSLAKTFELGSVNTAQAFVSYLEDAYLIFSIPKFDYSLRRQAVNPKKTYSIDNGLSVSNSTGFSADRGRMLENTTFLHLRRRTKDVFYFKEKNECDFVAKGPSGKWIAIQACHQLHEDNLKRELDGLVETLVRLKLNEGTIVTFDQDDTLTKDDKKIHVIPAWKWMQRDPLGKRA